MTKSMIVLVLVLGCGDDTMTTPADAPPSIDAPRPDAPVDAPPGGGGDRPDGMQAAGCNPATGAGCNCGSNADCPIGSDTCVTLSGANAGAFCANACTSGTGAQACAVLSGQNGVGACVVILSGSTSPNACGVLCGHGTTVTMNTSECPAGFVGMILSSGGTNACFCLPPP